MLLLITIITRYNLFSYGCLILAMPRHSAAGSSRGGKDRKKGGDKRGGGGRGRGSKFHDSNNEDSSECCQRLGNLKLEDDEESSQESEEEDQFGRKWPKINPPFNVAMWDLGQCMSMNITYL